MDAPDLNTASASEWADWARSLMGPDAPTVRISTIDLASLRAEAEQHATQAGAPFTGWLTLVVTPEKHDWLWDFTRSLAVVHYPSGRVVMNPTLDREAIPLTLDQVNGNEPGELLVFIDKAGIPVSVVGQPSAYQPKPPDLSGIGSSLFKGIGLVGGLVVVVLVLVLLAESGAAKVAKSAAGA